MTNEAFRAGLKQMFSALRTMGVNARMNFSCCSSCASYELATAQPNKPYAFYNKQDAEDVKQGWVFIGYSSNKDDAAEHVKVGRLIADTARSVGLEVEWDGTAAQRVLVKARAN